MDVKIATNLCIGCDVCVDLCPDVFKIDIFEPKVITNNDMYINCVKDAIDFCPVKAIYIE